jgi:alkanesulfonate monooxygenase SsuD/methylene tetrahydromethanopterin reductase-like flavin-dependent oxidoreductase (luciferase family)
MTDRLFRFGVVAAPEAPDTWQALARSLPDLGYSTLLMPDGMQLLAPFPALATAAAVSPVRVGTFVLASPLRPSRSVAWEGHSLSVLSGGRFEFGIGTGRPAVGEWAQQLGLPFGSPAQRLRQVEEAIDHLRELDGQAHTPVMMAVAGPRARALAAAKADIVALAAAPLATRDEVAAAAAEIREHAGNRAADLELSMNLFAVGDQVPPGIQAFIGVDAATLIEHDSLAMVRGTPQEIADELRRRRDAFGASYITVNGAFYQQFAPVVELLAGR